MANAKNNKRRSLYLIIIAVSLIIIMVALGIFIYWKYFQTSDNTKNANTSSSDEKQTNNNTPTKPTLTKFTANSALGYNFSFSYPSTWKQTENFSTADQNELPRDLITVVSPTGKVSVKYVVGYLGGIGGMCDETDISITDKGSLYSYHSSPISGVQGTYLIDNIYTKNKIVTSLDAYISRTQNFDIGGNYCQQYLTGYVELSPKTEKIDGNAWSMLIDGSIMLTDLQNEMGDVKQGVELADITTARASEEYKQAEAILLSTAYSKI